MLCLYGLNNLPNRNPMAQPRAFDNEAMAVAVVLCSGANHSADIAGGAPMDTGPAKPFRN